MQDALHEFPPRNPTLPSSACAASSEGEGRCHESSGSGEPQVQGALWIYNLDVLGTGIMILSQDEKVERRWFISVLQCLGSTVLRTILPRRELQCLPNCCTSCRPSPNLSDEHPTVGWSYLAPPSSSSSWYGRPLWKSQPQITTNHCGCTNYSSDFSGSSVCDAAADSRGASPTVASWCWTLRRVCWSSPWSITLQLPGEFESFQDMFHKPLVTLILWNHSSTLPRGWCAWNIMTPCVVMHLHMGLFALLSAVVEACVWYAIATIVEDSIRCISIAPTVWLSPQFLFVLPKKGDFSRNPVWKGNNNRLEYSPLWRWRNATPLNCYWVQADENNWVYNHFADPSRPDSLLYLYTTVTWTKQLIRFSVKSLESDWKVHEIIWNHLIQIILKSYWNHLIQS